MRELRWSVTVDDSERWTAEHLAACEEDDPGSYDDWALEGLREAMEAAGNDYIKANPDLFRGELI